jgi:predicted amidohydrolase
VEEAGGRYFNTCHIYDCGRHIGYYRKQHITSRESAVGLSPGERSTVFEIRGFRLGVLICADVLYPESYENLIERRPDVIAVPTVSPYLEHDPVAEKYRRDLEYFVQGAQIVGAYIVKACGVGSLMGSRLQGRSLICSPQKVLSRVKPSNEMLEATLIEEVDLDALPLPQTPKAIATVPQFLLPPGLGKIV